MATLTNLLGCLLAGGSPLSIAGGAGALVLLDGVVVSPLCLQHMCMCGSCASVVGLEKP